MDSELELYETRWSKEGSYEVKVSWMESRSAQRLTYQQRQAAHLCAELEGDSHRVDALLELPPGTVQTWFDEDENFKRVVAGVYGELNNPDQDVVNYANGLKPKQMEAARLYYEEELTQTEVAKRVGVSARTIRNWMEDPLFRRYGGKLMQARERRLRETTERQDRRARERLVTQRDQAMRVYESALAADDVKVATELLRPWLKAQ